MTRISVCTPCFNERESIRRCYETVRKVFEETMPDVEREHIFADNGSTDGTVEILREIAANDPCVKVILNMRNFGIIRSSMNGILSSSGDAVFMFMPADLQDPPELMPQFVKLWREGYEVVYGTREIREEHPLMRSVREMYYKVLRAFSSVQLPMNISDYQLLDKRVIDAMRQFDDAYPFVRAMPFQCTSRTIAVPYTWRARAAGVSKNRLFNLIDQGLNGFIATTHVPIRLALLAGFLISACSILYAVVNVVGSLFAPEPMVGAGIRTLIAGMFLFNGIILFFLGVLGEYVLSIHQQVRRPPRVVERERINFDTPPRTQQSSEETEQKQRRAS
ncbi:MAG: glycosyltransferase family 2 protein [Alphaproteobacteria bacterium]|nr:glycosyltransferase family 2 protein [Alphaproteobacteria bacterium]